MQHGVWYWLWLPPPDTYKVVPRRSDHRHHRAFEGIFGCWGPTFGPFTAPRWLLRGRDLHPSWPYYGWIEPVTAHLTKVLVVRRSKRWRPLGVPVILISSNSKPQLKPQDSFGEFDKFFLDLQKVQVIIRKHHQTFLLLFGMTYCNTILPNEKLSLCT